jgi:hypothetical protein
MSQKNNAWFYHQYAKIQREKMRGDFSIWNVCVYKSKHYSLFHSFGKIKRRDLCKRDLPTKTLEWVDFFEEPNLEGVIIVHMQICRGEISSMWFHSINHLNISLFDSNYFQCILKTKCKGFLVTSSIGSPNFLVIFLGSPFYIS